jgi:hypothetical protein
VVTADISPAFRSATSTAQSIAASRCTQVNGGEKIALSDIKQALGFSSNLVVIGTGRRSSRDKPS